MRTIIIGLLALASIAVYGPNINAETHYRPHISIGAKAGMTFSNMTFSPSVKQGMKQGMTAGVAFRYAEEKNFGLIAEVNFVQRGWQEDFEETDFIYKRQLTYIQIPLLTHVYFGGRRFKGFLNAGPEIGFLIGDHVTSNFDYRNPEKVEGFPIQNRTLEQMSMDISRKFDYGITAGPGCEFYIRPRHSIVLEARYYFGIGNIFPDKKKDVFSASRGSSIIVTLGYNFRLR